MFNAWILLSTLLFAPGVKAFMLYNTQHALCLHGSKATDEVSLKKCNLKSDFQQWLWMDQGMLMCVASSRCLLATQSRTLNTQACEGVDVDPSALMWECDKDRLISRNASMLLSVEGQHLTLSHSNKYSKWKSLDTDDICRQSLRYKRASDDDDPNEATENEFGQRASMTEKQREYLRWFYRTEDPTMWKFVLLGVAFLCLLAGFLLLGLGTMANKNRKKIAKYKAAAMAHKQGEELQSVPQQDRKPGPSDGSPLLADKPSPSNSDDVDLKAGNIVVTWNDGNVSQLFQNASTDDDNVVPDEKAIVVE